MPPANSRPPGLFFLVILGAAISIVGAVTFLNYPLPASPQINVFGAEAARRGWPEAAPHDQPAWPAVTQWEERRRFGYARQTAWSAQNRTTTHQMQADKFGWPATVLVRRQLWWPWNDPTWRSSTLTDTHYIRWDGVAINAAIFTVAVWLVWFAPPMLVRIRRRKLGRCLACGYDLRGAPADNAERRCPECGTISVSPHG